MNVTNIFTTVRSRLLVLAIGLEVIMLTIMIVNSIRLLHEAMTGQVRIQAEQFRPILIAALTAPLAQRDYATLQAIVDESRAQGNLDYIVVADRNDNRLVSSGLNDRQPLLSPTKSWKLFGANKDLQYRVDAPVSFQGVHLGKLHFGIDLTPIKSAMRLLFIQALVIAAIEIFISSVALVFFGFWLTRHMKTLTHASLEVADGNLSPPVVPEGNDDVGKMGVAFNIMSRAISARVRELTLAKENSETRETQLKSITDSVNDAILMMDRENTIIFWNPAATQIFGYTIEEAIGRQLPDLLGFENDTQANTRADDSFVSDPVRKITDEHAQLLAKRKNGSKVSVDLSMSKLQFNGEWHTVTIIRDISELQEALKMIEIHHKQLEDMNLTLQKRVDEAVFEMRRKDKVLLHQGRHAAMGEMIGNIAHQWRQPLNTLSMVIANLESAFNENDLTEACMDEAVGTANRLIQKMSCTINDFRDYLLPQKQRELFLVRNQIQIAVSMMELSLKSRSVSVEFSLEEDLYLTGFQNEFSQVVLNLLNNAKEAIIEANPHNPRIVISSRQEGDMGIVSIEDNGCGISSDNLDKIFEPYYSTKSAGTGIGLYMSKIIVEQHMHGKIEVKTFPGGSEFSICIPLFKEMS